MTAPLAIEDLRVTFNTRYGQVTALDGVSLHVNAGETLGGVGESGSDKTTTAMAATSSSSSRIPIPRSTRAPASLISCANRWT